MTLLKMVLVPDLHLPASDSSSRASAGIVSGGKIAGLFATYMRGADHGYLFQFRSVTFT